MPPSSLFLGVGVVLSSLSSTAFATQYQLTSNFHSSNWLLEFTFDTNDYNHGYVNYLNSADAQSSGLYNTNGGTVNFGIDSTQILTDANSGRKSIKFVGQTVYNHGLFILDVDSLPSACGAWPSFWVLGGGNWPTEGEIDIIEGVNAQATNQITLHTDQSCQFSGSGESGTLISSQCSTANGNTAGCSVQDKRTDSLGSGFNGENGGYYVMEWTTQAIKVWFFPRDGNLPKTLTSNTPDSSNFGTPVANFAGGSGCNIDARFKNMNLMFTNNLCGDWAGNVYSQSSCPQYSGLSSTAACKKYVQENPHAFNTKWNINSLKVFSAQAFSAASASSSSSSMSRTSTRSSTSSTRTSSTMHTTTSSVHSTTSSVHSTSSSAHTTTTSSTRSTSTHPTSSSVQSSSSSVRSSSVRSSSTPTSSSTKTSSTKASSTPASSSTRASSTAHSSPVQSSSTTTSKAAAQIKLLAQATSLSSADPPSPSLSSGDPPSQSSSSADPVVAEAALFSTSSADPTSSSADPPSPTVNPSPSSVDPASSSAHPGSFIIAAATGAAIATGDPAVSDLSYPAVSASSYPAVSPTSGYPVVSTPCSTSSTLASALGYPASYVPNYPASSVPSYPVSSALVSYSAVSPASGYPVVQTPCSTSANPAYQTSSFPAYPVYPTSASVPSYPTQSANNGYGYPAVTSQPSNAYSIYQPPMGSYNAPSGYSVQGSSRTTITTTYTTTYVDVCSTGYTTKTTTRAVTYCPTATPATPTPGYPAAPPPGFSVTTKVCTSGCGNGPQTVTVTLPCQNCGSNNNNNYYYYVATTPVPQGLYSAANNQPAASSTTPYAAKVVTLNVVAVPASQYYASVAAASSASAYAAKQSAVSVANYAAQTPAAASTPKPYSAVAPPPAGNATASYGAKTPAAASKTGGYPAQFTGAAASVKRSGMLVSGSVAILAALLLSL